MRVEQLSAGHPPPEQALEAARAALEAGLVVALPTDTVYGLAIDPGRSGAADRLFAAKRRPRGVELPMLVADLAQAFSLAAPPAGWVRRLMERFWPGPLTVVVRRRPGLCLDLGDNRETVGIRCPNHPVPRELCGLAGPLAVTSANRHGRPPLSSAQEVVSAFAGHVEVVLDGGRCDGEPSTVVDCTGPQPRCLREGGLAWADVVAEAGTDAR